MANSPAAPNRNLPDARYVVPQHVASRAFPTETVLLNLNTGQYHGLNPTGGLMFEVLGECGSLSETAARVATEFGQPREAVASDLRELCVGLIGRGLLEAVPE